MTNLGSRGRSLSPGGSSVATRVKTTRQCRAGRGGRFGDPAARRQWYFDRAVEVVAPILIGVLVFSEFAWLSGLFFLSDSLLFHAHLLTRLA